VRATQGRLQARRLTPRLGVALCGTQDVRQLQHEPAQVGLEALGLGASRGMPGMRDQAGRHLLRATYDLALDAHGTSGVPQHLFQGLALALTQTRRGQFPQLGQAAPGTLGHVGADLALELQRMPAQSLAFDAARGHVLEHGIDQAGQRVHELGSRGTFGQHHRETAPPGSRAAARSGHGTAPAARG